MTTPNLGVHKIGHLNPFVTSGSRGWARFYSDAGSLFLRITNIDRENLAPKLRDCKFVSLPSSGSEGERTRVRIGDILVSITADLGAISYIDESFQSTAYVNQHIAVLRIDRPDVNNKYVAYFLASEAGQRQFRILNDSGSKAGLNLDAIRRVRIWLPERSEQNSIVAILAGWDRSISLTESLIAAKLEQRKGLMQQLLSGKRRFPGFTEPWREVALRNVTTESKQRNNGSHGRGSVRAVTNSAGMVPMREQTIAENLERYKVVQPAGFAYNPMRINVGSICMWQGSEPALVSPDYVVFTCNEGELDPDYFNYLRQTHRWDYYMAIAGNGSVRVRIYYDDLGGLHFKIPPYDEQKKISALLGSVDREIAVLRDQLAALKEQKKGLMQQLLTGKRRVTVTEEAA